MRRDQSFEPAAAAQLQPAARSLASGKEWSISEYICIAGPEDRPFEERHEHMTVAAVAAGSFKYRSDNGTSMLYPGSFLLGNHGTCYECGHDHSRGDRCIALHIAPHLFEEIAASVTSMTFKFSTGMYPASRGLLPEAATMEALASSQTPRVIEDKVTTLIEGVIVAVSGSRSKPVRASARQQKRVVQAIRYIEEHANEATQLDEVAADAGMSKYHFLRTFRHSTGLTPYQFLLSMRMRKAAVRLASSLTPISAVAFEEGFGDLSTFNNRFRNIFGMTPQAFRKSQRS